MICHNCGQIIPDGSPACPVCPFCGAQLGVVSGYGAPQQPYGAPGYGAPPQYGMSGYGAPQQQYDAPGYGAPPQYGMPGYGVPQQQYCAPGYGAQGGYRAGGGGLDFSGWLERGKRNVFLFATPVALLLTFIFLFVKKYVTAKVTVSMSVFGISESESLKASEGIFGTGFGFVTFSAVVLILCVIWQMIVDLDNGMLRGYKNLPGSQFYSGVVYLLFTVIGGLEAVSKTKDNIWSIFGGDAEDIEMAEKWGAKLDTGAYLNLSFYFLLAAGILLLLPPIIRAAKHQPPYEV